MSRSDSRSTSLRHRPSRSIPAVIVSLVLIAIAAVLLWVGISRLAVGTWPAWLSDLARQIAAWSWGSVATLATMIVLAVVGLVVLLTAILPGAHNAVTIRPGAHDGPPAGETDVVMGRRAIARLATAQADLVDGVDSVSASVSPSTVHLAIATSSNQTDTVRSAVTAQVSDRLRAVGLQPVPRVVAQVRSRA